MKEVYDVERLVVGKLEYIYMTEFGPMVKKTS